PFVICCMTIRRIESSKETTLPPPPPLRTGQISFPISGSSLSKRPCDGARHTRRTQSMMELSVARRVEQHPIVYRIAAAVRPPDLVVEVPRRRRGDPCVAMRTASLLPFPEVKQGFPSLEGRYHLAPEARFKDVFPLRIIGIGLARNLGVSGNGQT